MLNVFNFNGNRLEIDVPVSFRAGDTPEQASKRKQLHNKMDELVKQTLEDYKSKGLVFKWQINSKFGREYFIEEKDWRARMKQLHSMNCHNFYALVMREQPYGWITDNAYKKLLKQKKSELEAV